MSSRLPDFLIIGAMKSGTTTLHHHLEQHQGIFMSSPKETNFFSIDQVYGRGSDWYRSLFASAHADQRCGEASPSYTRYPRFAETTDRIAEMLPNAKLVYIMRHPVDRFYSNYVFDRSYGHNDSIRETIRNRSYVLQTSNYMLQIEQYLRHFSREQMLFLLLDDLEQTPEKVLFELYTFLDVPRRRLDTTENIKVNPRGRNFMARQCNTSLQRFRGLPGMRVMKRLVPTGVRGRLRDSVTKNLPDSRLGRWMSSRHAAKAEPLTPELRRELLDRLDEPTRQLEVFLGRDLAAWRN